ncbi:hypothetical protein [Luteimonas abyssi]|uniref:hypothetical protein n=1 Tax=Luteimonas abyssi TaxID=1247514 RepID=UPI001EE3C1FB|nr:hypothetical protein [Luteimonas abyssi]
MKTAVLFYFPRTAVHRVASEPLPDTAPDRRCHRVAVRVRNVRAVISFRCADPPPVSALPAPPEWRAAKSTRPSPFAAKTAPANRPFRAYGSITMQAKLIVLAATAALALSACQPESDTARNDAAQAEASAERARDAASEALHETGAAISSGADAAAARSREAAADGREAMARAGDRTSAAAREVAADTSEAAASGARATSNALDRAADRADEAAHDARTDDH